MRILALDSSGMVASVAVLEKDADDTKVLAEYSVNYKKTHSQTLLPMVDTVVQMTELDLHTLDAIAVAAGPGSFTGLRIGSATAKGLGLALHIPLISIPTLEGLAYNLWGTQDLVCPILDARRDQVYAGLYVFEDGQLIVEMDQTAMSVKELAETLREKDRRIAFLGDGVPVFQAQLEEMLSDQQIAFAPANLNRQRAASVGALAFTYYEAGKTESAEVHKPIYLRPSQAERVRKEQAEQEGA